MKKILLVEDDPSVSLLYQKAFTFEGFEVTTAFDGAGVYEQVLKNPPSIVLLDIILPTVNGLEVLRKLKSDQTTQNIPVVMLSNLDSMKEIEEAVQLGANKYITKGNYEPAQVVALVKKILENVTSGIA